MKLVEVIWDDSAHLTPRWRSFGEIRASRAATCETVGYVVKRSRRWLLLSSTVSIGDSEGYCAFRIPTGAIRRIRRIRR